MPFIVEAIGGPQDVRKVNEAPRWFALPLWWAVYWPMVAAARWRLIFVGDAVTYCLGWARILRALRLTKEVG